MAKCPKCGNQLPDDAAFCGVCGSPIANNANGGKGGEIPTFTPPNQGAPIFTPPKNAAPTFQWFRVLSPSNRIGCGKMCKVWKVHM